jgi:NADPH:quinone reductase-like Zn-dependent oxidoreductase
MAQMRAVVAERPDGPDGLVVREVPRPEARAVLPGETVAALMGEMGRAIDGGYAEYALVPEHQLIALDTTLPWDVLGALPETFVTAAGSLEHLDLEEGETLLLRGATSSVGLACLQLARAAGVRVIATTRSEGKARRGARDAAPAAPRRDGLQLRLAV